MSGVVPVSTPAAPKSLWQITLLAGAFMGFMAWDQSHWWLQKSDYTFGWLVPFFVGYVIYERWPAMIAACTGESGGATVQSGSGLLPAGVWRVGAWVVLVGGALMFLLGAVLRAAAGASYPASLAIATGCAGVILGAVAQMEGDVQAGRLARLWVFPALVWLLSAPMVSLVENALNLFLLGKITSVACFVFDGLGLAIERQGNVLVLPTGQVGIAEACSGIRSLMGCLFAGAFLGAVSFSETWKKLTLLGAAMVFAVGTNLLRSLFLTGYAYRYGPAAIEGTVHDVAGYAVLGLTAAGLLLMVQLFSLRVKFSTRTSS